jgi:hypothetical protein
MDALHVFKDTTYGETNAIELGTEERKKIFSRLIKLLTYFK